MKFNFRISWWLIYYGLFEILWSVYKNNDLYTYLSFQTFMGKQGSRSTVDLETAWTLISLQGLSSTSTVTVMLPEAIQKSHWRNSIILQ